MLARAEGVKKAVSHVKIDGEWTGGDLHPKLSGDITRILPLFFNVS
jgi:hypothetical protein